MEVEQASAMRETARQELEQAASGAAELLSAAGIDVAEADITELLDLADGSARVPETALPHALDVDRELAELRGRIDAVAERPTSHRLLEARTALEEATAKRAAWQKLRQPSLRQWVEAASATGIDLSNSWFEGLSRELAKNSSELSEQDRLRRERTETEQLLATGQRDLASAAEQLASAQAEASTLVEGLGAIRAVIPTTRAQFATATTPNSKSGTSTPILTTNGPACRTGCHAHRTAPPTRRTRSGGRPARTGRDLVAAQVLDAKRLADLENRRTLLESLDRRLNDLDPIIREGETVNAAERDARRLVEELETADREYAYIDGELTRFADRLGTAVGVDESAPEACRRLSALSGAAIKYSKLARLLVATWQERRDGWPRPKLNTTA